MHWRGGGSGGGQVAEAHASCLHWARKQTCKHAPTLKGLKEPIGPLVIHKQALAFETTHLPARDLGTEAKFSLQLLAHEAAHDSPAVIAMVAAASFNLSAPLTALHTTR